MRYEVRDQSGPVAQFMFLQDAVQFLQTYPILQKRLHILDLELNCIVQWRERMVDFRKALGYEAHISPRG